MFKVEIFDDYRCELGEGPTARGAENTEITWVDILGQKVFSRKLNSKEHQRFETESNVGFALPAINSGLVLGIGNEIFLRSEFGKMNSLLVKCLSTDALQQTIPVRWNDAKVAPSGELFAGSMEYNGAAKIGGLYKIAKDRQATLIESPVTISNGLDWNMSGNKFFFIDTPSFAVQVFDYDENGIKNKKVFIELDKSNGMPDGMCSDAEDGLWIAYFGGSRVERYSQDGKLTHTIVMPVANPTSVCFAGKNLDLLIITSARVTDEDNLDSGKTFAIETGFVGQKNREFNQS